MHVAALAAALFCAASPPPGGGAAPGAAEASEPPPASPALATKHEPANPKVLGLQASLGAPDGIGLGAFVRPIPWLRVDGGVAYNVLAFGIQGGVTFMPWTGSITPTLRLGVGQYFSTDVRDEFGDVFPDALDPALQEFGYHFYTAQLGLELGDENGLQFFARGGLAWIRSDLEPTRFGDDDTTVTTDSTDLSATTPSVQLGLLLHLW